MLGGECLRKQQTGPHVHSQVSIYFFGAEFFEPAQSAIGVIYDHDINVAKCPDVRTN
jgi:hypothetical protein